MPTHATAVDVLGPGELVEVDPTKLAIFTFLARYRGLTLDGYKHDLSEYLGWCMSYRLAPLDATRGHLELYSRWLEERISPATGRPLKAATVNRRLGTVLLFYKYAAIDDYIVKDPAAGVRRPKVDREQQARTFLPPLAFAAVLKQARKMGPAQHAAIAILGMMGLRISEAAGLDVTDVHMVGGYEVVRYVGKGNKAAESPLPVPVMHAVHVAIDGRLEGPILLNSLGNRMTRHNAADWIRTAMRDAGVPGDCTPHGLRRTFCTSGLLNGVGLRDMQIAMRHADPGQTALYDRMGGGLDRHASHQVAGYLASMAG